MIKTNRLLLLGACATPAAIYLLLREMLRANFGIGDGIATYLVGIAANFVGAMALGAIIFLPMEFLRPERPVQGLLVMSAAIGILLLAVREFAQISTGGTFDVNDLLWTVLGAAAFYGISHWLLLTGDTESAAVD